MFLCLRLRVLCLRLRFLCLCLMFLCLCLMILCLCLRFLCLCLRFFCLCLMFLCLCLMFLCLCLRFLCIFLECRTDSRNLSYTPNRDTFPLGHFPFLTDSLWRISLPVSSRTLSPKTFSPLFTFLLAHHQTQ